MDAQAFRQKLRACLESVTDKALLRVVVGSGSNEPVELTGQEILDRAQQIAELHDATTEPGDVVLLLLPHSVELFLLHIGLVLRGRLPAILAWPTTRVDAEKYQRNLLHQLRNLPAHLIITTPALSNNLAPHLTYSTAACAIPNAEQIEKNIAVPISFEGLGQPELKSVVLPDDTLFLQFSGGTTGAQKAVAVTSQMHVAQLEQLQRVLNFSENDGVVSWLPLYHDMGLIACLWFPLWHGAPSLQFSATDWLLNPEMLFYYLDRYRATFCWLPNFAFSYLAGRRPDMQGSHALNHVRGIINCSEPVRLRSMDHFREAFAGWGLADTAPQACYAMAENVFAVTQTPLQEPPATYSRAAVKRLKTSYDPPAFDVLDDVYVSSGRALEQMEVRVMDGARECSVGEPGEIQIRTESLFCGYWSAEGFTRTALLSDGWYATGDYGFLALGELFVIGRMKDIVIVGGQNIFPEDVEAIVNTATGVYPGRVVAFGVVDQQYDTEALAIVAELRGEYDRKAAEALERVIKALVLSTIGVAPRYVSVVPERWIVKSTAGKISRRDTRARFTEEVLQKKHPVVPRAAAATGEVKNV